MLEMLYQKTKCPYIYVKENALTKEQCQTIIHFLDNSELSSREYYQLARGDLHPEFNFCKDIVIRSVYEYMEDHPFLKVLYKPFEIDEHWNLQKYYPGQSYCGEHMEHGAEDYNCRRLLAWMFYLNDVEDGGETYWPQQNFKKPAREGDLCIWPASWTHSHKGLVSNTEIKYIATGWCSFIH